MGEMFKYSQRVATKELLSNYDRIFTEEGQTICPKCKREVLKSSKKCWGCGERINRDN